MPPAPRSRAPVTLPTYTPMIPTLVSKPFHRDGWVYEEKVDGYRMLAVKDRSKVRLVSRNGVDHTSRYPDVAAAIRQLPPNTLVLDGEIAVFDQQLRSGFDWLRHRQPEELATPPVLIAFDLVYVNGRTLRSDRSENAERGSRFSWTGPTSCTPRGDWRRMGWRHGPRCLSAAMRGTSRRTKRAPTPVAEPALG